MQKKSPLLRKAPKYILILKRSHWSAWNLNTWVNLSVCLKRDRLKQCAVVQAPDVFQDHSLTLAYAHRLSAQPQLSNLGYSSWARIYLWWQEIRSSGTHCSYNSHTAFASIPWDVKELSFGHIGACHQQTHPVSLAYPLISHLPSAQLPPTESTLSRVEDDFFLFFLNKYSSLTSANSHMMKFSFHH